MTKDDSLTVAHLDQDPRNCDDDNLVALCQRCHLGYDAEEYALHPAETRCRRLVDAGQTVMALD